MRMRMMTRRDKDAEEDEEVDGRSEKVGEMGKPCRQGFSKRGAVRMGEIRNEG